jgi:hypothetical protein
MNAHLIEEVGGSERPAVITKEGFALAIERFEHVLALLVGTEAEAAPQLPLEDVKERSPPIATIAAQAWEKARSSRRSLRS